MSSRKRATPSTLHSFFSLAAGAVSTGFLHDHRIGFLTAAVAVWLCSLGFIQMRSRAGGGRFLDDSVGLYHVSGLGFFLIGLFMTSFYYVIYG